MLVYIDGLYLKHLAQIERRVKRQLLDQIRWDNSRVPLPGDRYEKPVGQKRKKKRRSRPTSAKTTSTKTSRSTFTSSLYGEPKRKPRSVHVDWGHQAKSLAVDLGENPKSFSLGIGPINPGGRKCVPRTPGGGGGLQVEQEDGTNVLIQSGEGARRGTTNVEINKGRGQRKGGTKIKIDSAGKDRSKGSTTVSIKKSKKETCAHDQGGTDIKVKSYGKDITIKNASDKRHPKESTKIDIKHGSKHTPISEESTKIDIHQDSGDDDCSEKENKVRRKNENKRQKRSRPSSKGSATSSKTTSTSINIEENSENESSQEKENDRESRIGDHSKRSTRVVIQHSDEENLLEEEAVEKTRVSISSADEYEATKTDTKTAINIGTQTTWMDTEPDPPPALKVIPQKQIEPQGVRKLKYIGEKTPHYEYQRNYVDIKERDADDLFVSITEPAQPEPVWREIPKKTKPEVIHYINYEPQESLDTYDPVFVKPLPMPKPPPKRPHITHPLVKVGGGWMRPSDYQHSRIPLDVQQHEQPITKNKYLVIKSRPAPRPEPSPIYYRQFEKHSSVWPMYYPVRQAWEH